MKFRNPNPEIGNKSSPRRPKGSRSSAAGWLRALGFRPSVFFRISDFGFRISVCCLLLAMPALALADPTNGLPDQIPPLRPPRAEIPPTFWDQSQNRGWLLLVSALLLALVAGMVWLLTQPKPEVVVPPAVRARQSLELLFRQAEDGGVLSQVSQILRRYLQAAFDLAPEEMTTAEFCRAIGNDRRLGSDFSAAVAGFLRECDERKFSPPAPMPALGAVPRALRLIETAEARREQLRQVPPAVHAGGGAGPGPSV